MTIINKIRELLSMEIKLEQFKTDTGAILEAEVLEAGQPIFIVTEEEAIPVTEGSYTLEDGQEIKVNAEGIIEAIGSEEVAEPEAEQEMEAEAPAKKVVESTTKETHFEKEEKVMFSDEQKETLKDLFNAWYAEMSTMTAEEIKNAEIVDLTEEKEELSEVKPIKHSLEKNTKKVILNTNKNQSLEGRIAARLWG